MKKLYPLLSVLFLISSSLSQNKTFINNNFFFTKSKYWKVKELFYTSTEENLKRLKYSNDGIFLENDTLHFIKDYKFDEVPDGSKIFQSMNVFFSDSSFNLKIEGYENDNMNFPYNVKGNKLKIDFSMIDKNLNDIIMKISRESNSKMVKLNWVYKKSEVELNYSVVIERFE